MLRELIRRLEGSETLTNNKAVRLVRTEDLQAAIAALKRIPEPDPPKDQREKYEL